MLFFNNLNFTNISKEKPKQTKKNISAHQNFNELLMNDSFWHPSISENRTNK